MIRFFLNNVKWMVCLIQINFKIFQLSNAEYYQTNVFIIKVYFCLCNRYFVMQIRCNPFDVVRGSFLCTPL